MYVIYNIYNITCIYYILYIYIIYNIYVYIACPLPTSSCYTLCSLVPQITVFTIFSERYAIRKPLYIRTYFLFVRELESFRRLCSSMMTIARQQDDYA